MLAVRCSSSYPLKPGWIDNYFILFPLTTSTVAGPGDAGADGEEEEADHARVIVLATAHVHLELELGIEYIVAQLR